MDRRGLLGLVLVMIIASPCIVVAGAEDSLDFKELWTKQEKREFSGDYYYDSFFELSYSPDGSKIAVNIDEGLAVYSGGVFGANLLWKEEDVAMFLTYFSPVWSPDGSKIALVWYHWDNRSAPRVLSSGMKIFDSDTGDMVKEIGEGYLYHNITNGTQIYEESGLATHWTSTIDWSPDGSTIAVGVNFNGTIHLVNVETGTIETMLDSGLNTTKDDNDVRTREIVFSPDGTKLVVALTTSLYVWDVEKREIIHTRDLDEGYMVDWSNNGETIAIVERSPIDKNDCTLTVIDTVEYEEKYNTTFRGRYKSDIEVSPDDRYIAIIGEEGVIIVSSGTGNIVQVIEPDVKTKDHEGKTQYGSPWSISWHPDGDKIVISAGYGMTVWGTGISQLGAVSIILLGVILAIIAVYVLRKRKKSSIDEVDKKIEDENLAREENPPTASSSHPPL